MRPDFFVEMGPGVSSRSLACSKCRNVKGRVLPFSEQLRYPRWFLRCAVCGHVWTIDKTADDQQRPINQRLKSARKAFDAAYATAQVAVVIAKELALASRFRATSGRFLTLFRDPSELLPLR
jgi:hypothetical protein